MTSDTCGRPEERAQSQTPDVEVRARRVHLNFEVRCGDVISSFFDRCSASDAIKRF